jgi:hypothetical protein
VFSEASGVVGKAKNPGKIGVFHVFLLDSAAVAAFDQNISANAAIGSG